MQWSDIPRSPTSRTLRQFALLCLVVFSILSLWQGWARGNLALSAAFAAAALLIGTVGLVRPQAVRWIFVGWMMAAFPIGWTISKLMLILMYFGLLTPLATVLRLAGRDALRRRATQCESYWVKRPAAADVRSYFRQS
jgi:TRAP-type C4-dicarboxylate transport system permease small subunit